jgi:hypothetical protein
MLLGWDAGRHGTFQAARNGGGCHQVGPEVLSLLMLVVEKHGHFERVERLGGRLAESVVQPKDFDHKRRPNGDAY